MQFITRAQAKRDTGITYLGGVNISYKINKNTLLNELTYILYLAPHNLSGYNVCPKATKDCKAACLHESGHNRIDTRVNKINNCRINRTRLFYEDREFFMMWLIEEIQSYRNKAFNLGMTFSVRLNGTSDLSPEIFKINGVNILQIFPDVKFYDYTKVFNRTKLLEKYPNYDLTFSFSGENWHECEQALHKNVRVAVVFEELPKKYKGFKVIDGDITDVRHLDKGNVIVGLKFKKVRNKIDINSNSFIIRKAS